MDNTDYYLGISGLLSCPKSITPCQHRWHNFLFDYILELPKLESVIN